MKYEDKILDALVKNHGREKRYNKVTFKLIISLSHSKLPLGAFEHRAGREIDSIRSRNLLVP